MEYGNFRKKSFFLIVVGRILYRLMGGWKVVGEFPEAKKYVMILAYHTSNWDFFVGIGCKCVTGLRCYFMAKESLFIIGLGWVLRKIGGVPVSRGAKARQVDQMVERIKKSEYFVLSVAPEGTRGKVARWKTGFYYIAIKAGIPILPVAFDYKKKELRVGELFFPGAGLEQDMKALHEFFLVYSPKYPENACRHGMPYVELSKDE